MEPLTNLDLDFKIAFPNHHSTLKGPDGKIMADMPPIFVIADMPHLIKKFCNALDRSGKEDAKSTKLQRLTTAVTHPPPSPSRQLHSDSRPRT